MEQNVHRKSTLQQNVIYDREEENEYVGTQRGTEQVTRQKHAHRQWKHRQYAHPAKNHNEE